MLSRSSWMASSWGIREARDPYRLGGRGQVGLMAPVVDDRHLAPRDRDHRARARGGHEAEVIEVGVGGLARLPVAGDELHDARGDPGRRGHRPDRVPGHVVRGGGERHRPARLGDPPPHVVGGIEGPARLGRVGDQAPVQLAPAEHELQPVGVVGPAPLEHRLMGAVADRARRDLGLRHPPGEVVGLGGDHARVVRHPAR